MAVYQKSGMWWIDYYHEGRRYRQKIGSRRRAADEALSRVKVKIAAGDFVSPDQRRQEEAFERKPMLFETFVFEEFLPWLEVEHSRSHFVRQSVSYKLHLVPYLKGLHLHEITQKRIEDYKPQRLKGRYSRGAKKRPVTKATVNRELSALRSALAKAVEWGRLEESPAAGVRLFKETPKTPRLLEVEEISRLMDACRTETCPIDLYAWVCCIAYVGLRRAELLHLRWDEVDWVREQITVKSRTEWHTKNYKSRTLPMNDTLIEALRRVPRRLGCQLVFPSPQGKVYQNIDHVSYALDRAATQAGIPEGHVTFHQLRHCFCSHAQMQGVSPRTVQQWMGHKDLKTTLRYSHVSPVHEKAAMKALRYDDAGETSQATSP
jgi:integrase